MKLGASVGAINAGKQKGEFMNDEYIPTIEEIEALEDLILGNSLDNIEVSL